MDSPRLIMPERFSVSSFWEGGGCLFGFLAAQRQFLHFTTAFEAPNLYDRYIQCSIIQKKSLQEEMAFNIQYNCHGKILETPLYGPHIYMFTQYLCCLCYSQFLRIVHGLK